MRAAAGGARLLLFAAALILASTIAFYAPVTGFEFVAFDDDTVVTANPALQGGLSAASISWALRTTYFGNWMPLTWFSHLLDVALFGMDPHRHHVQSVLLHAITSALCFVFLGLRPTFGAWNNLGAALHRLPGAAAEKYRAALAADPGYQDARAALGRHRQPDTRFR